jgi:hydroxypyruvate reductase
VSGAGPVVALLAPLPAALGERLRERGFRPAVVGDPLACEAVAAVTRGSLATDDAVFAGLPRLQLLCLWGAGHDGVDLAAARRRGIAVANSPSANSSSVADLAIGFVIALLRRLPEAERHLRSGGWSEASARLPAARGLTGARLGIYGFGAVGRRVAVRAQALEMEVGAFSRRPPQAPQVQAFGSLLDLAAWADVLVVAAPGNAATFHSVDAAVLTALGPQGCLVNVSRGSVVAEAALCEVLARGELGGFAADVFESEPQVPAALREFPNAVLTPHVGGATRGAQAAQVAAVIDNLQAWSASGRPCHPLRADAVPGSGT